MFCSFIQKHANPWYYTSITLWFRFLSKRLKIAGANYFSVNDLFAAKYESLSKYCKTIQKSKAILITRYQEMSFRAFTFCIEITKKG